jgi:hypothetical protein
MKKFKWMSEEREVYPSKDNIIIVDSIELIIKKISEKHSFKTLFEQIKLLEYTTSFNNYDHEYGDFKKWLEKKFSSLRRTNTMGMFPPLIIWKLQFEDIKIRLTKEQGNKLLTNRFSYYKHRISEYLDGWELRESLFYDLGKDEFTTYL